jgi:hypothetical protein
MSDLDARFCVDLREARRHLTVATMPRSRQANHWSDIETRRLLDTAKVSNLSRCRSGTRDGGFLHQ